jgi:hypothetical protein
MFFNNNNCCNTGGGSFDMILLLLLLCGGCGNFGGHNGCGGMNKSIEMCDLILLLVLMSCFGGNSCCK